MARNATTFKPGKSGNPKGKPKGAKDRMPRGLLKQAIAVVMAGEPKLIEDVIRRNLKDRKKDLQAVELIGKVTKEIGPTDAASALKPTVIIIKTNVNLMALAGPTRRKALTEGKEGPDATSRT